MGGGKRNRHHGSGGGSSGANSGRGGSTSTSASGGRKSKHADDHSSNNNNNEASYDFCQRFFGDPLFTNLNVSLLFLTATFLPLIVWIPHFASEHAHNRQLRLLEEERLTRMQIVKMEMEKRRMRREALERDVSKRHSILEGVLEKEVEDKGGYDESIRVHQQQQFQILKQKQQQSQQLKQQQQQQQQQQQRDPLDSTSGITILREDSTILSTIRNSKSTDAHNFMYVEDEELDEGVKLEGQYEDTVINNEGYYDRDFYPNPHSGRKKKKSSNSRGGVGGSDDASLPNHQYDYDDTFLMGYTTAQHVIPPTLCPDGITIGYDDWFVLRDAISMTNSIAAMNFLRWNEYLATNGEEEMEEESPEYIPPEPFVICPGMTLTRKSKYGWRRLISPYYWISYWTSVLRPYYNAAMGTTTTTTTTITTDYHVYPPPTSRTNRNKLSSIFINAEDITIECDTCVIDLPGTHFSFGPHAKNVHIRGITFRGATTSSLTFHHHGSDVRFEDCYWLYNSGSPIRNFVIGQNVGGSGGDGSSTASGNNPTTNMNNGMPGGAGGGSTMGGAVADLNSTSIVAFYRCVLDETKQTPKRTTTGAGVANVPGMNPPAGHLGGGGMMMNQGNGGVPAGTVMSSLTIRS
jgi:G:T/U-mismatch repair DNA glycosylase